MLADAALSLARDRKGSLAKGQLSRLLQPTSSLKKHASPAKDGTAIGRQRSKKRFKSKPDGSAVGEDDSAGTEGPEGVQQPTGEQSVLSPLSAPQTRQKVAMPGISFACWQICDGMSGQQQALLMGCGDCRERRGARDTSGQRGIGL